MGERLKPSKTPIFRASLPPDELTLSNGCLFQSEQEILRHFFARSRACVCVWLGAMSMQFRYHIYIVLLLAQYLHSMHSNWEISSNICQSPEHAHPYWQLRMMYGFGSATAEKNHREFRFSWSLCLSVAKTMFAWIRPESILRYWYFR